MAAREQTPPDDGSPAWLARFRSLALALPEVIEQDHWGRPSFRVNKKIFATLWPDDGKGMIKLTPDQQDEHVERRPGTFEPVPGGWGLQGATFVRLRGSRGHRNAPQSLTPDRMEKRRAQVTPA